MKIDTDRLNRCIEILRISWEELQQSERVEELCDIYSAACFSVEGGRDDKTAASEAGTPPHVGRDPAQAGAGC